MLPIVLVALSVPAMLERSQRARSLAQQAARAMVRADTWESGVLASAALTRHASWAIADCDACLHLQLSGSLDRAAVVTASVDTRLPLVVVPWVGSVGGWEVTLSHSEYVDGYRSFP